MEKGVKNGNDSKTTVGFKTTADPVNGEDDSETSLLLAAQKGGRSKKSEKSRRKVQWNDHNGNKLAEVLEFDPRDKPKTAELLHRRTRASVERQAEDLYFPPIWNFDHVVQMAGMLFCECMNENGRKRADLEP